MRELVVPYELAVILKEKGFKKECEGFYTFQGNLPLPLNVTVAKRQCISK